MCWTMCMTNSWSASASTGEISATATSASPVMNDTSRQPTRRSRALGTADPDASATGRGRPRARSGRSARAQATTTDPWRSRRHLVAPRAPRGARGSERFTAMWCHALSLLVPPSCCACGAPTARRRAVRRLPARAAVAGRPALRALRPARALWRALPRRARRLLAAWAPVAHAGPARELVAALKFRGALRVADAMAAQIAARAPRGAARTASWCRSPATGRVRTARGFDHADCLARALARRTGLPTSRCAAPRRPRDAPARVGPRRSA